MVVVGPINQDQRISLVCRVHGGGWCDGGGGAHQSRPTHHQSRLQCKEVRLSNFIRLSSL